MFLADLTFHEYLCPLVPRVRIKKRRRAQRARKNAKETEMAEITLVREKVVNGLIVPLISQLVITYAPSLSLSPHCVCSVRRG